MFRPLASAVCVAGRRSVRCSVGVIPGRACRRWLSVSTDGPPSTAADAASGTDARTSATPSPDQPGTGGADMPDIPSADRSISPEDMLSFHGEGQEVDTSPSMLPPTEEEGFSRYADVDPSEWHEGTVMSITHYGAFVTLDGDVDGLVHISQLDPHGKRVESVYTVVEIGQPVKVRIIEVDHNNRKLRLTMREEGYDGDAGSFGGGGGRRGQQNKSVDQFLNLSPEEWISGTVSSIAHFGAFVTVDDQTSGLLHISQVAEEHVSNVSEHLQVGQEVQVRVVEVHVDKCQLALSMLEPGQSGGGGRRSGRKDVSVLLGRDPDEFITGRVVSIVPYGAFVNIGDNIDGLLHISEMAAGQVDYVEDVCQMGQEVQVRIIAVNTDNNTVNLSMVAADA